MKLFLCLIICCFIPNTIRLFAGEFVFRIHEIAQPGGNNFGQTSAVDVDKDGDLDFISGRQSGDLFWFENQGTGRWPQHQIGESAKTDVGGTAFDVDGDGWIDQVSGGTWYRNPGKGHQWQEHVIRRGLQTHESVCADVDGDGDIDILTKPWNGGLHLFAENLLKSPSKKTAP